MSNVGWCVRSDYQIIYTGSKVVRATSFPSRIALAGHMQFCKYQSQSLSSRDVFSERRIQACFMIYMSILYVSLSFLEFLHSSDSHSVFELA